MYAHSQSHGSHRFSRSKNACDRGTFYAPPTLKSVGESLQDDSYESMPIVSSSPDFIGRGPALLFRTLSRLWENPG